ncbi:odorant receptor 43a-like [Vanessa cardui]|uniref:odorant receptor 43a-like n=1 Tax=Vanessa cardui TaxID=171605 RepID=UPI001F13843E|nr:odorant receptor 43a-like [Vanessa cardui]
MKFLKQTECFNRHMKYWKFLGIYPLEVKWKFYNWYSKIFVFAFIILFVGLSTFNFYFFERNLDDFIEETIFYFTELAALSKVLTCMVMKKKIEEILKTLDSEMFQPINEMETVFINNAMKFNVKYWKIVAVISYFSHFVHILSPFIAHLVLPVPLVLPVSSYAFLSEKFKDEFIYQLYLYQTMGIHMLMLYNVNIDTFFLGLMILVIAQLEILEHKFMTVTNKYDNNVSESLNTSNRNGRSKINDIYYIEDLNKAIIRFDRVAKFCDLIENVFSITLFVQFSMASCIICVCLFRFTLPAPFQYYMFLATYMFVMTTSIMVPCWFGTRIITKSRQLSEAIYICDWTPRCRRFKSSIRVFVERANRPLSITGWKMFPLSLSTFTSIMNSAYSFFTLLRHMQTRQS